MRKDWTNWILSYTLPDDVHWYKMNGRLIFTLSGYHVVETNYVYLSDTKDTIVKGIKLDDLLTEREVHKAIANTALQIQVDLRQPKSYRTYYFNGKQIIVAP